MDWNGILQGALLAVVTAVVPVLVKLLADWVQAHVAEVMNEIDQDLRYVIDEAVRIAVSAAEQSGLAKLIKNEAEEKKRFACEVAERYLAQYGVVVDLDVLADLIEAEVLRQFNREHPQRRTC